MQTELKNAHSRRGFIATLARFVRGRRGVVSPIMAMALIPIIGAMGIGAEASNWWLTQRSAQNAADAAAMAAAVDAGNNYVSGNGASTVPAGCSTATTTTTSWYCQAKAAAAKFNFVDGSNNVTVTPTQVSCTKGGSSVTCVQVVVQKAVPLYLLNVIGYTGSTTINGSKYQNVVAVAKASLPGPPIQFCLMTTSGDISASGTPNANLLGCDTFTNGNTNCSGGGISSGESFGSGPSSGSSKINSCTISGTQGHPAQAYECDPYGATTQSFTYNDGSSAGGPFSESCPNALDVRDKVPADPSCASPNSAINGTTGSAQWPAQAATNGNTYGNIITASQVAGLGAGNTTIQVCGNAALGAGTFTNTAQNGNKYNPTVNTCTGTITYSGSANIQIIIYNGSLDLNGCTLESTGSGGVTVIFAPTSAVSGTPSNCSGSNPCIPIATNSSNSGGTIDIAAPESGNFKGIAIMQSGYYTEASGSSCSGNKGGALDWCNAGNQPILKIQGGIYMPDANLGFSGAVSKFDGVTGALSCMGVISASLSMNGTGSVVDNTFVGGLTSQCNTAGWNIPTAAGTHTFYQALVG